MEFYQVAIMGVPLLFVVIGLVEYIKKMGVDGKWLLGASMLIGIVFGGGFQIAEAGLPPDFAGWFSVVVYGIGLGLVSSGMYDAVKGMFTK